MSTLYMRTAGTGSLANRPITGSYVESRVFSDEHDNVYEYLKSRQTIEDLPILDGEPVPSGERGIYFTVSVEHQRKDIASGIASVGHALGVLPSADIKFASLEDAAARWIGGISVFTETVFASNARTKSDLAEELGWVPKSDDSALKHAIQADVKLTAGL
ncbi:hypothetical protein F5X98DRAFT_391832 [Xylaria grammica]|nr:hypothetical protein F5X98DRAFT_391832 [Xylaria grammica]